MKGISMKKDDSNVQPKPKQPATLVTGEIRAAFGQQFSTFTELTQGKTSRAMNLFTPVAPKTK